MIAAEISTSQVVHAYLRERFPTLRELTDQTPLLTSGAVDSLGMLDLMMFLSERFDIALEDADFEMENLATPQALVRFVESRSRP